MSIGAGSFTLTRLQVLEKPGRLQHRDVIDALRRNAISPIGIDEVREHSMGWCHPHTGEPDFSDAMDWFSGDSFLFGLRMDSKKVPGTLYKLQLRSLLEEMDVGRPAGSGDRDEGVATKNRKLRELAKERVKQELLKRTLPSIKLVEIVWNLQNGEIWLSSSSQSVFDAFDECFTSSFSLPYVFQTPGTSGLEYSALIQGASDEDLLVEGLTQAIPWGSLATEAEGAQRTAAIIDHETKRDADFGEAPF